MLCGEFLNRIGASPLSTVSLLSGPAFGTRSPYFTLLTLCQGMAALTANPTTVDDDDIFLGKLLGFVQYRSLGRCPDFFSRGEQTGTPDGFLQLFQYELILSSHLVLRLTSDLFFQKFPLPKCCMVIVCPHASYVCSRSFYFHSILLELYIPYVRTSVR
jgi:hypothetical protein